MGTDVILKLFIKQAARGEVLSVHVWLKRSCKKKQKQKLQVFSWICWVYVHDDAAAAKL